MIRYLPLAIALLLTAGCGVQKSPRAKAPAESPAETQADSPAAPADAPPTESPGVVVTEGTVSPGSAEDTRGMTVVRSYTEQFYAGDLVELHSVFTDEMKETIPFDQLEDMQERFIAQYGDEIEVLGEEAQIKGEYRGYARWAKYEKQDDVLQFQWILRDDDTIAGFFIQPVKAPE